MVADEYFWLRVKVLEGEAPAPFGDAFAAMRDLRSDLSSDPTAWEDLEVPLGAVHRASELYAAYADLPLSKDVGGKPVALRSKAQRLAKAIEATELKVPLLIENTAGGDNAMARRLDRIAGVWEAISQSDKAGNVGFCLDTCHAWAGGIDLGTAVEQIKAITGRIDLVHANDSRDGFDSGADRHANFGAGQLPPDDFAAVVKAAGSPVVCETPGGVEEHQADLDWLRAHGIG